MARKVGQIIARGDRRWLIRFYLGRDHETKKRKYRNRTIHGSIREAQAYLTKKLRERDLGRDLEGAWRPDGVHVISCWGKGAVSIPIYVHPNQSVSPLGPDLGPRLVRRRFCHEGD
jgi:hypothetical protein